MDKEKMKQMADRSFRDVAGAMATALAWAGIESGLFRTMQDAGPMSLETLTERSGLVARYVEEWAKGMVSAGYLDYDPADETYELPVEHAFLLASEGTDHYFGGLFSIVPPIMQIAPKVLEAFHQGGGVPFSDFPLSCRSAIDLMNRGNYEHRLIDYWLQQLPDCVEQLQNGGRALDLGCGHGHVVSALAQAFPKAGIVGVEPDSASINSAQQHAEQAGLGAQIEFVNATLDQVSPQPGYDLILACDVVHDLPQPVSVLAEVRERLNPEGVFLVIEPRSADQLEDNINPISTMFYGISLFHCMTQSLAQDGVGLGACMGPAKTQALLGEAGFSRIELLDIRSPVNLFYAARI